MTGVSVNDFVKTCTKCGRSKPWSEFYRRNAATRSGLTAECKTCASKRARQAALRRRNGVTTGRCTHCSLGRGMCDDHEVPPVCVCVVPTPNGLGECQTCKRPYKPEVPGFTECREAWRTQLEENTCV